MMKHINYVENKKNIIDLIFIISCFFYPISIIYLMSSNLSIKRHIPFILYFFITIILIYFDPKKSAIGKEGIYAFVIALSCSISFLVYVFSKHSELPSLRNNMKIKYKNNNTQLILIFFLEALVILGLTILLLCGIWPAKSLDIVWSNINWQLYGRCFSAFLLFSMTIKLILDENGFLNKLKK